MSASDSEVELFEIDVHAVGDAGRSGDAISARFTEPGSGVQRVVVIDSGFKSTGVAVVEHVKRWYDTDVVDLAVLTHPDEDHINGFGEVVRGLRVKELWLHDLRSHGGSGLQAASAVADLISVAQGRGTSVAQPWPGASRFGDALTVLGPTEAYYSQLVSEQVAQAAGVTKASVLREAAMTLSDRAAGWLGDEVPFLAGEVNPRNNSSMILLGGFDGRTQLFCGDAGVPALEAAWTFAELRGLASTPDLTQLAHHGSRRNCSSAWLDRLLGPTGQTEGSRQAFVSCVAQSDKHPSGKVVNAHQRRGCAVTATAGTTLCYRSGSPMRAGWHPVSPLAPMVEEAE